MKLNNFNERDQNKIVLLAIKIRTDVVDYKGNTVHLPSSINALFICVDRRCNATRDVTYYVNDVINNNVAQRIACIKCAGAMNRKFIGVNINQVLNKHMKHVEDYSNKDLMNMSNWISEWD